MGTARDRLGNYRKTMGNRTTTLFPASVVGSMPRPAYLRDALLTDGEYRRASYIGVIAELAHGFEVGINPADGRPWTIVVDRIAPKRPGFIAEEVRRLRQITDRPIKATLTAPALLG